jgi:MFS family permease
VSARKGFAKVTAAGISFQAGSAAVDSSTIVAALIFQLSGSSVLVGAVTAILRFGWLFPQLFVGFLAQNSGRSMPFYIVGAFGRTLFITLIALVLALGAGWGSSILVPLILALWTLYAFVSGIVAVPYNDIVARTVASESRSRLLAARFFGGGLLALGVVWIADRAVGNWPFPASYAAIFAMAAVLMLISSVVFTSIGEPEGKRATSDKPGFFAYLRDGVEVFRSNPRFRLFVYAQWLGGVVLMAMPFYVVAASLAGFSLARVALLLGAQTVGALASNLLWGWWGDRLGKGSLLRAIAFGRIFPAGLLVALAFGNPLAPGSALPLFLGLFFALGALANGLTIAVIGYLMEISPDDLRPAYSGYFNALTAPAFLLPLLAGLLAVWSGLTLIFALSALAAVGQFAVLLRLRAVDGA